MYILPEMFTTGFCTSPEGIAEPVEASSLEWMKEHTILEFDPEDVASLAALPACAKLFVVKYSEILGQREGVASQSIEGLSQSFHQTGKEAALWQLAHALLGPYLKSQVRVFPARRRW